MYKGNSWRLNCICGWLETFTQSERIKVTSLTPTWCFYYYLEVHFKSWSYVSYGDIENRWPGRLGGISLFIILAILLFSKRFSFIWCCFVIFSPCDLAWHLRKTRRILVCLLKVRLQWLRWRSELSPFLFPSPPVSDHLAKFRWLQWNCFVSFGIYLKFKLQTCMTNCSSFIKTVFPWPVTKTTKDQYNEFFSLNFFRRIFCAVIFIWDSLYQNNYSDWFEFLQT